MGRLSVHHNQAIPIRRSVEANRHKLAKVTQMISNFDEVKKQLSELSEVINKFKSEAVHYRSRWAGARARWRVSRVLRGGCWIHGARNCRAALRLWREPTVVDDDLQCFVK